MRLPVIHGLIRRRLLINFRVDAQVMADYLPKPFTPQLHAGNAIAGICLIRLEAVRPARWWPNFAGLSNENAAHRIAVRWHDRSGTEREGVFVPRRDTNSRLNHLAGGRLFPGEHHLARFEAEDDGTRVAMAIRSHDGKMSVDVRAREADALPASSCFASLAESSAFFQNGCVGYSVTRDRGRFDGIRLRTRHWRVRPLEVESVASSFFADAAAFPAGSVTFDHALLMRDIPHEWHHEPDLRTSPPGKPVD